MHTDFICVCISTNHTNPRRHWPEALRASEGAVPARGRPGARARRGEGKVYKRGRLWSIRWTENGERRYSGGYLSEDNAKKVLAVVGLNIQAGRPGLEQIRPAKAPDLPTFGSLVDEWLAD